MQTIRLERQGCPSPCAWPGLRYDGNDDSQDIRYKARAHNSDAAFGIGRALLRAVGRDFGHIGRTTEIARYMAWRHRIYIIFSRISCRQNSAGRDSIIYTGDTADKDAETIKYTDEDRSAA